MRRRRAGAESWFDQDPSALRAAVDRALAMAGRRRWDVDVLELYDPFSVVTLCLLEGYGFCEPGHAGKLARAGALGPGASCRSIRAVDSWLASTSRA